MLHRSIKQDTTENPLNFITNTFKSICLFHEHQPESECEREQEMEGCEPQTEIEIIYKITEAVITIKYVENYFGKDKGP